MQLTVFGADDPLRLSMPILGQPGGNSGACVQSEI